MIDEPQSMHTTTGAQSVDEDDSSVPQLESIDESMQQVVHIASPQTSDNQMERERLMAADEDELESPEYVSSPEPTDDDITSEESSDDSSDQYNDEMQVGSQLAGGSRPTKISGARTKRVPRRATKPPRRQNKKESTKKKVQQSSKTIRKLARKADLLPMAVGAAHHNRSVEINERRHPPSQILPQTASRAAKLKVQAAMTKPDKSKMTKTMANPPKKSSKRLRRPANATRAMGKVQAKSKAIKKKPKPSRRTKSRKPSKSAKRAPRMK